jgi:hypothetical protein
VRLPDRLFWTTYRGLATVGLGALALCSIVATAMLLLRSQIEPVMPYIFSAVTGLIGRHTHTALSYNPAYYLWIVGYIYFIGALCKGTMAYAAYRKPAQDRRIDEYLRRRDNDRGLWNPP